MCVSVALVIQHAMRMQHIVICDLSGYTIFLHISHKRPDFRKEKILNIKCMFFIFSITFV